MVLCREPAPAGSSATLKQTPQPFLLEAGLAGARSWVVGQSYSELRAACEDLSTSAISGLHIPCVKHCAKHGVLSTMRGGQRKLANPRLYHSRELAHRSSLLYQETAVDVYDPEI